MNSRSLILTAAGFAASIIFIATDVAAQTPPPAQTGGWAVVGKGGKLVRNSNAIAAKHLSTGKYEVDFANGVATCAYTATVAGQTGLPAPAHIVVAHAKGVPNGVTVGTFDTVTLLPSDNRFVLNVSC